MRTDVYNCSVSAHVICNYAKTADRTRFTDRDCVWLEKQSAFFSTFKSRSSKGAACFNNE